jgi:hypothetical protein
VVVWERPRASPVSSCQLLTVWKAASGISRDVVAVYFVSHPGYLERRRHGSRMRIEVPVRVRGAEHAGPGIRRLHTLQDSTIQSDGNMAPLTRVDRATLINVMWRCRQRVKTSIFQGRSPWSVKRERRLLHTAVEEVHQRRDVDEVVHRQLAHGRWTESGNWPRADTILHLVITD